MKKIGLLFSIFFWLLFSNPAFSDDLQSWLNSRIADLSAPNSKAEVEAKKSEDEAKIDQRGSAKQTEAPAISDGSTSLVDETSASDLISVAMNLAGLSGTDTEAKKKAVSVTVTAYSVYSAIRQQDPLDPAFYNAHRNWRRLSITLGYENPQDASGSQDNQKSEADKTQAGRATIVGAKYLIIHNRDAGKHRDKLNTLYPAMKEVNLDYGFLVFKIEERIINDPKFKIRKLLLEELEKKVNDPDLSTKDKQRIQTLMKSLRDGQPPYTFSFSDQQDWTDIEIDFFTGVENELFGEGFSSTLKTLGPASQKELEELIRESLEPFKQLDEAAQKVFQEIQRAPQFSVSFQAKTRNVGTDEYKSEGIFDYGVTKRLNLTLNGAFEYDDKEDGSNSKGGCLSGQLQFQVTPEKRLTGRNPIYFDVSGEADWMQNKDATYKTQLKVKIPIMQGIDLPVSITFANRTELIKESDVRGEFGFSFDLAKLAGAAGFN